MSSISLGMVLWYLLIFITLWHEHIWSSITAVDREKESRPQRERERERERDGKKWMVDDDDDFITIFSIININEN